MMDVDCIFCKIAAGTLPSYTIYEDGEFKIILDRFPWIGGHTLIILKRHAETFFELTKQEGARLFELTSAAANALNNTLTPDGLNIIQNNGEAAGQSVAHFHMHIIPRYKNDEINILFPHNDPPVADFEKILPGIKINFKI